jgi:hypothetical protein
MNDLMSGGLHRLWKDHLVSTLGWDSESTFKFRSILILIGKSVPGP